MPVDNLPGERIESLVDELEGIIEEARPPFGKSAQQKIIETDVFFNILDEIRMSYPEEWQKSRRILKEREELLASAAAQADSIILSLIHISEPTRQAEISYAVFCLKKFFFLMIRRPPRSTRKESSAASDVYKRQHRHGGPLPPAAQRQCRPEPESGLVR